MAFDYFAVVLDYFAVVFDYFAVVFDYFAVDFDYPAVDLVSLGVPYQGSSLFLSTFGRKARA